MKSLPMNELIKRSNDLLKDFEKASDEDKWYIPFPMAVFGTLRLGCGNTPLMGSPLGKEPPQRWGRRIDHNYDGWSKAFLPHFHASGLTIYFGKNDSAVFEVFFYDPKNWKKMIPSVDSLEGFSPSYIKKGHKGYGGYHRTLMWLHLLPSSLSMSDKKDVWARGKRTWGLSPKTWDKYPRIPAWAYSNMTNNEASRAVSDSPVIWTGTEDEPFEIKSSIDKEISVS